MSVSLAVLLLTHVADPLAGLKPGETVVVLDRALAFDSEYIVRSRVLNANTGEPLADVLVEAWTEDGSPPQGIAQCVDRTFSKRDGSIELDCIRGNYRGEKVRVSKAGFASMEVTLSDLFDGEIVLSPAWPFEGRLLDLDGKPVVGAIVRTRESCAHAVKASQVRTDAFGRFRMWDCPTNDNGPEIEVLGEYIAPVGHFEAMDLRKWAAFYGSLDIYVAKRAPVDLRLVDAAGAPMARRRLITREAPMYEGWTDDEGVCRMFPPLESRDTIFWVCDTGPELTVTADFPTTGITNVLPSSIEVEHALGASLTVTFEGLDAEREAPRVLFSTERGQQFSVENDKSKLPIGRGRLLVGGRFFAYAPLDLPLELEAGINRLTVALTKNPRVHVKLPVDRGMRGLLVQAGDDSMEAPARSKDETFGCFVPRGVPITMFNEAGYGELRRVQLPALTADAEVDMTADSAILRPGLGAAEKLLGTLHFKITDRDGRPIEGARGRVYAESGDDESAPAHQGAFTWTGPAFATYRAAFTAPGCTSLFFQGSVPSRGDAPVIHVVMQRRAHLSLTGAITSVIVPGARPETVEGGFEFDVAPGPLMLRVLRPDADPLAIELNLAEGETRRLEVR